MLSVRDLVVDYEGEAVLRGLNLDVADGEIVAVLGPSGCGKTTLLRTVAGLETPVSGGVWLADRALAGVPPHQRGIGLMFQSFALFPHLTVLDNVAFGVEMQGAGKAAARQRGSELLALVGLAGFESRAVTTLSGGEQQRVALARSLAPSPRLLMLDEPLGSLDAALRERLTLELRDIFRRVQLSALYVTHDQHEALAIADRVAVMRDGLVEQIGSSADIYRAPASTFVAGFLGLANCLPASLVRRWLPDLVLPESCTMVLLHPEGITLDGAGLTLPPCRASDVVYLGDVYRISLAFDEAELTVRIPLRDYVQAPVTVGDSVRAQVDPAWVRPVRPD